MAFQRTAFWPPEPFLPSGEAGRVLARRGPENIDLEQTERARACELKSCPSESLPLTQTNTTSLLLLFSQSFWQVGVRGSFKYPCLLEVFRDSLSTLHLLAFP